MPPTDLLQELAPVAESLVERHFDQAREWFPHEVVPWELGPQVRADLPWQEADATLPAVVRSALYVNLLTEDNLPYYHQQLDHMFGRDGAWRTWTGRWTAEEGRHSIAIRDYLILTRAIDPRELERARMHQVSTGQVPRPASTANAFAYLTMQELATRIAHLNTGKLLSDPAGREVMRRVASDENLHFLFYRDMAKAAIEIDPSTMLVAIEEEVRAFEMPGTGIPGFVEHARQIAAAGIYDFAAHHDQILLPVVWRHWDLASLEALTPEAERARDGIDRMITRMGRVARRLAERREASAAEEAQLTSAR
jgi:acyl-[acyl-carrier-protein] desaturase